MKALRATRCSIMANERIIIGKKCRARLIQLINIACCSIRFSHMFFHVECTFSPFGVKPKIHHQYYLARVA